MSTASGIFKDHTLKNKSRRYYNVNKQEYDFQLMSTLLNNSDLKFFLNLIIEKIQTCDVLKNYCNKYIFIDDTGNIKKEEYTFSRIYEEFDEIKNSFNKYETIKEINENKVIDDEKRKFIIIWNFFLDLDDTKEGMRTIFYKNDLNHTIKESTSII